MPDEVDWLLAPVHAGMCRYESLVDGTLSLHDIALMNDSLIVRRENEALLREIAEKENGR